MNSTKSTLLSRRILAWVSIAACVGLLVYIIAQGQFVRPFQDDFYYYPPQTSQEMSDLLHERFHWTGRFSTTTMHLLVGWLQLHWVVPMISILLMSGGIFAFSRVLIGRFSLLKAKSAAQLSLLMALGITLVIFLVTPSPYSSIFWLSGAPIHFWSYGCIFLYLAYITKRILDTKHRLKLYDYFLFAAGPAIIGMFSEIAMFALMTLTGLILVSAWVYKSRKLLHIGIVNSVGVAIAFYSLFFSLGAIIRRGAEKTASFSEVLTHAPYVIAKNIHALFTSLMSNKWLLLVLLLSAVSVGLLLMKPIKNYRKMLIYVGIISVLLLGLVCLNFVAVYSSVRFTIAWSRTQAFSVIVLVSVLTLYGVILGTFLRQKLQTKWVSKLAYGIVGASLLIVVAHAGFVPYIQTFAKSVQERAVVYDEREKFIAQLKTQGLQAPCPVIQLKTTYLYGTQETFDITAEPSHALNEGVRRYYRLPCHVIGDDLLIK